MRLWRVIFGIERIDDILGARISVDDFDTDDIFVETLCPIDRPDLVEKKTYWYRPMVIKGARENFRVGEHPYYLSREEAQADATRRREALLTFLNDMLDGEEYCG